jgi:hypothetical protein
MVVLYKIRQSHSGSYAGFYLLGYNAIYSAESQQTVRMKMEATCSSETSAGYQQNSRHHMLESGIFGAVILPTSKIVAQ